MSYRAEISNEYQNKVSSISNEKSAASDNLKMEIRKKHRSFLGGGSTKIVGD